MQKLFVLLAVLAVLVAAAFAMPAPEAQADSGVEIIPSMLVHEEHIPAADGAAASDKTLAKFVEELLALRGDRA